MSKPGSSFVQLWEQKAKLSEQEQYDVKRLAELTTQRPMPANVPDLAETSPTPKLEASSPAIEAVELAPVTPTGIGADERIETAQDFLTWFAGVQARVAEEQSEKYRSYLNRVKEYHSDASAMGAQVEDGLKTLDTLSGKLDFVKTKTESLYNACENLLKEKNQLVTMHESIRSRLAYFDELERITKMLNGRPNVASEEFIAMLTRLDECITYTSNNAHFRDASSYLLRFRSLQNRGLTMVKQHAVATLRQATANVLSAAAKTAPEGGARAEEASAAYLKFRAVSSGLRPLMGEIEGRSARPEYASLLEGCHECYYQQRLQVLGEAVDTALAGIMAGADLSSVTREGCLHVLRVCQLEFNLFNHFFAAPPTGISATFVENLCGRLYEDLRPRYIRLNSVEAISELCGIVKLEILEENIDQRGEMLLGARPMIQRMLADLQDRLTFRAQLYVRDEIRGFSPAAQDLDYPNKLVQEAAAAGTDEGARGAMQNIYRTWYPTLERTLMTLSKLYRSVDVKTFEGLAQEAVSECTRSLIFASKLITKKKSPLDGHLFLVKHLLILREQISPFKVDFSSTEKSLDLAPMAVAVGNLISNGRALFRLSSDNALLNLMQQGAPRVLENAVDAKEFLEKQLKGACDELIEHARKKAISPLLTFNTKVDALISIGAKKGPVPLRTQPFASPENVRLALQQSEATMEASIPQICRAMAIYLANAQAQATLFRPIKHKIVEGYRELQDHLIKNNYSDEDRALIGMTPLVEITARLEGMAAAAAASAVSGVTTAEGSHGLGSPTPSSRADSPMVVPSEMPTPQIVTPGLPPTATPSLSPERRRSEPVPLQEPAPPVASRTDAPPVDEITVA